MRACPHSGTRPVGRGLVLFPLLLGLGASCAHEPAPASAFRNPSVQAPPSELALREQVFGGGEAVGRLYDSLAALEGPSAAAGLLLEAATGASDEALKTSAGARTICSEAVYRAVQTRSLGDRFERVRALVDRLDRVAPKAPQTLFSLAYLRWLLISDGRGGLRLGDLQPQVARDLQIQLATLAREHPDFDGPGDFDRRRIAGERDAVALLLTGLPTETTPTETAPTEASGTHDGG